MDLFALRTVRRTDPGVDGVGHNWGMINSGSSWRRGLLVAIVTVCGCVSAAAQVPWYATEFHSPAKTSGSHVAGEGGPFVASSTETNLGNSAAATAFESSRGETTAKSDIERELEELKKRLEVLEKQQTREKSAAQDPLDWIDVSTEKWTVKLGGHVQLDYITWPHADPAIVDAVNYFSFRRLRLVADGTGYGKLDFRLQMTLEPGLGIDDNVYSSPDVKDAYLSVNDNPWIGRFRIGNFFVPFSLEQVTNDTNNIFTERSIPTQGIFAPDREVGIAFYNCTPSQNLTWTTGMFFDDINDTVKTRFGNQQGFRLSGRATCLPYYDEPSNGRYLIHTGAGVLYTDDYDDRTRFRARPQIQRGPILIDSRILLAGSHLTGNLESAVVWGPVTLQSEAFLCRVNMETDESLYVGGAYSHLSYFLTGENRIFERFGQHGAQFARNVPFTNFFLVPNGVGWGAWEAKARWSYLDIAQTNHGQYNDFTVGFNWYWTDRTRIMFDWIHPITSSQTVFGATESDVIAMRFDFNW
jgi:phosphate-selective porin OprO/OprP